MRIRLQLQLKIIQIQFHQIKLYEDYKTSLAFLMIFDSME